MVLHSLTCAAVPVPQDPSEALFDFKDRVTKYEAVYEECVDDEVGGKISYIKLYNVGQKVVTHRCSGYIPSHVAFHLMNVHISPRKIWLSRHSESPDQASKIFLQKVVWFLCC